MCFILWLFPFIIQLNVNDYKGTTVHVLKVKCYTVSDLQLDIYFTNKGITYKRIYKTSNVLVSQKHGQPKLT